MSQESRVHQRFARKIAAHEVKHPFYEGMMNAIGEVLGFLGSIPCCFCFPTPYVVVDQGSCGLVTRFGRAIRVVDEGMHRINPVTEGISKVNTKMIVSDIPRQNVLTKDNVGINIDSVLYYQIIKPYTAVYKVQSAGDTLIERTQATLRQVIGLRTLQECIENRAAIGAEINQLISEPARKWGLRVESILIKDLLLPADILDCLSIAARQKREGDSKVIAAQAEATAAKKYRNAADILNTDSAMQIRYFDTLKQMAVNSTTNVVFMPLKPESAKQERECKNKL